MVDRTYYDTWNTRKSKLGTLSYIDYLKSNHWKNLKLKVSKRKRFKKCLFCNETKIELHHKDYKWILTPFELRSIIPLCRNHHQEIHDLSNKDRISVRISINITIKKYKLQIK